MAPQKGAKLKIIQSETRFFLFQATYEVITSDNTNILFIASNHKSKLSLLPQSTIYYLFMQSIITLKLQEIIIQTQITIIITKIK